MMDTNSRNFGSSLTRLASLLLAGASLLPPVAASAATPPSISGTAAATVIAGQPYSFQPTATDADGDTLVFSITGKPSWASLNKSTGRLTGTPASAQVGMYPGIEISVTDGSPRVKLPKFTITVLATTQSTNHAPTISGSPVPTVVAGYGYSFQPSATDVDGNTLVYSITSKPIWASLNKATGRLTGAPTNAQVGSYEEIEISVSDGIARAKLPKFTIEVTDGAPVDHTVTLSWQAPTKNSDGTALTNLSGYRILYGSQPGQYTQSIDVNSVGLTSYVVENLSTGKYYFAMTAHNSNGVESVKSAEVSIDLS